jgi:hypothetical protein
MALMLVFAVVGCASQPNGPQAKPPTASQAGVASSPDFSAARSAQAQRLSAARNLNLKIIDKDGQQLFCRSSQMTNTHIQRDVICYTADQLDRMQAQMERDLDHLNLRPSQNQGLPAH